MFITTSGELNHNEIMVQTSEIASVRLLLFTFELVRI